ncbi:HAD hydrolase family protein [Mycoplasmopsis cynos]|nr:HAD hydrolase family protein [Mycoplasmopsis cynos]
MKKVAIFSDVDGTIYPFPSGILSKKNKDKVNEIVDRGVEFIINTGDKNILMIR